MSYNLKDVLKSLKVIFISKNSNIEKKELDILNLFFNKIIISNSAERALKVFVNERPDVIICDIDLPNIDGIEFCKIIRKINQKIPIIILSNKTKKKYLYELIRLQLIDFVVRPILPEHFIYALNQTAKNIINHGEITITLNNGYIYNYKDKTIQKDNENYVKLTKNEFRLLELLLLNNHKTLDKKEIEEHLWADEEITDSAFKSLFSRLRNKIGKECIKNSFGVGYQLN